MKIALFATATAAVALLGGAAFAQDPAPPVPAPGSMTGDQNPAQAPADKTTPPLGSASSTGVAAPPVDPGMTPSTGAPDTTVPIDASPSAPAAATYGQSASVTSITVTNGPVPDTAENRAKYGQPMSRAGKRTPARGN